MKLFLLACWLPALARATWTACAIVNHSCAYAVPALMDAGLDPPLLRLRDSAEEALPLAGVRALACCSRQGEPLAALDTCVVLAESGQRIAGDCLRAGDRDGAPGLALFQRLTLLAAAPQPSALFLFAAYDADAMRVAVGTPWGVHTAHVLYDNSAPLALALLAVGPEAWLLALTEASDMVWISQCAGDCVLGGDGTWELVDILPPADWRGVLATPAPSLLLWDGAGGAYARALSDWGAAPAWRLDVPAGTQLALAADGVGVWAIDAAAETRTHVLGAASAEDAGNCTLAGGFVAGHYQLCPPGTFSAQAQATACARCPPGTHAPSAGAVACAACPRDRPLQGPLATACVSAYPAWTADCLECPRPGEQWQQGACRPCPPMTYAPPGLPCAACAPGYASTAGASACTPRNTAQLCMPTGNASLGAPTQKAWAAYSLSTPAAGACALAPARNGTLWLVVAGRGLLVTAPPAWALAPVMADAVCALALTDDERLLYAADAAGGVWQWASGAGARIAQADGVRALALAGAQLFWLSRDGRIRDNEDAPAAAHLTGWGARLLCATADGAVGVLDPVQSTFAPLFALNGSRIDWLRAVDEETAVAGAGTQVLVLRLPTGDVVQALGSSVAGGLEDGPAPFFAAPAAPAVLSHADAAPMLLFVDASGLRALWARGCECAPGFLMVSGACAACDGATSDVGAAGCSPCGYRAYGTSEGACAECPAGLWWRAAPTLACALLWASSAADARYTLARAQRLALAAMPSEVYVAEELHAAFARATSLARADALLRPDALGAFWSLRFAWQRPYDPDGVAVPAAAALTSPLQPLPANAQLGLAGPPWNDARSLDPAVDAGAGWPARFNCTSPTHYWQYPSAPYPQGACLACAGGTFAWADDALACAAPEDQGPAMCAPGQYLAVAARNRTQRACRPCPPDTFANHSFFVGACAPKQVQACAPGAYVYDDGLGLADNTCAPCEPCDLRVPADANCSSGRDRAQPYHCVADHPPPGFFAFFEGDTQLEWRPCGTRPADAVWAQGPRVDVCYVRCRWGAQTAALLAFLQQAWAAQSETWAWVVASGLVPYAPALATSRICFPDASARVCPDGYFLSAPAPAAPARRRLLQWNDSSSEASSSSESIDSTSITTAEMATSMSTSPMPGETTTAALTTPNATDACVPLTELPAHAHPRTDGGWACDAGFFAPNASACVACAPASCGVGEWYEDCACYACPDYPDAHLVPGLRGTCVYECVPPAAPGGGDAPCLAPCASNGTCPPGQRWANCTCGACAPPLLDHAQPAPSSDGVCRVWCRAGFHTIERASLLAVLRPWEPQDPARVLCEPCVQRPSVPCPPPPPDCRDTPQGGCADGTYQCGADCVRCPAALGPLQMWARDCAVVCVRDAFMALDGARCLPCASLPVPDRAPYAGFHAYWNATPGARWWPPAYDPPHLRRRGGGEEVRAGLCWPCPVLVRVAPWDLADGDPCAAQPSPWLARALPAPPADGVLRLGARRLLAQGYTRDRRRLRWSSNTSFFQAPAPGQQPRCPRGWYADAGPRCAPCPRWTEGAADGTCRLVARERAPAGNETRCVRGASPRAFEPSLCACRPGTFLADDACRRCPPPTVSFTASNAPCRPPPRAVPRNGTDDCP